MKNKQSLIYILHWARAVTEKRSRRKKMLSPISIASPSTATFPPKLLSSTPNSSFNGLRLQLSFPIRVPLSAASFGKPSSSSVVMMAKRDEELKEIRAKTTEEINEEVIDLKGELLMLRLEKSVRNEFKASEFPRMRKRVSLSPSQSLSQRLTTCWRKIEIWVYFVVGFKNSSFLENKLVQ